MPLIEMRQITKFFPGIVANESVNFNVKPGEIHVLIGENGAGKSTLMNILSGLYQPDEGTILWNDKPVRFHSPRDAIKQGIGMMHQHFRLVPSFTVAENVALGLDKPRINIKLDEVSKRITELSQQFQLIVDPSARIWQLSVGEKQRVEILKLLYQDTNLLILDEPTAVLTPQEVDHLWRVLKRIVEEGSSIVLITHKLHEAMTLADRITVMRNGRNIITLDRDKTNEPELAQLMVGRSISADAIHTTTPLGKPVLVIENVSCLSDRGLVALDKVSFTVHAQEIVGIAGVAGNGQRELAQAVTGLRSLTTGQIIVNGTVLSGKSPKMFIDAGIAYIPEDRLGTGLCPGLNIDDNLILKSYRRKGSRNGWQLDIKSNKQWVESLVKQFNIKVSNREAPISQLSGGNLQKVVLARETAGQPSVIVAEQPTRGLDVSATKTIQELLLEQKDRGAALLMISEDLDEIINISDRIIILHKGIVMGVVPKHKASREQIGLMMAGKSLAVDY